MGFAVQEQNPFGNLGQVLGQGIGQGFTTRSDELSLKKAIERLPPGASYQDVLKTLTGTPTYSQEAKQQAITNLTKGFEFENKAAELKQKKELSEKENQAKIQAALITAQGKEAVQKAKADQKAAEKLAEKEQNKISTNAIIDQMKDRSPEEKQALKDAGLTPQQAISLDTNPRASIDYDIANKVHSRFEPEIKQTQTDALEAEKLSNPINVAIQNNEKYTPTEKTWDTVVDAINSPLLNPLKSKTGQELEAITPISISSFAGKMGGILTNRKIDLISKKAVGLGKDKDANRLFLYMQDYDNKLNIIKRHVQNQVLSENKYGLATAKFNEEVNKRMRPYQKMIEFDIDRMTKKNAELPITPISKRGSVSNDSFYLQPGQVYVESPEGKFGKINESLLNDPKYKGYKRL